MPGPSIIKLVAITFSTGLVLSAAIVTGAFLYVRYGDAPSRISELAKTVEVLEGKVAYLETREDHRSSLLTNATIRAAIKWVDEDEHPEGAQLSRTEAFNLALEAAKKNGRNLSDYREPNGRFSRRARENAWWVWFESKAGIYGRDFSITVQDQSRETKITPGL